MAGYLFIKVVRFEFLFQMLGLKVPTLYSVCWSNSVATFCNPCYLMFCGINGHCGFSLPTLPFNKS